MKPIAFTLTESGYTISDDLLNEMTYKFGELIISYSDFDIDGFFKNIESPKELSSLYTFDTLDSIEEYFEEIADKIYFLNKYDYVISNILINELELIERPYLQAGSPTEGMAENVNAFIERLKFLQKSCCSQFTETKEHRNALISMIFQLSFFADIQVHFTYNDSSFFQVYSLFTLKSLFLFELYQVQLHNVNIVKCKNCGRFFLPFARSDEKYCDRVFKDGKTCKDIGYLRNMDEFQALYRNAYKTQKARVRYNKKTNPNYEKQHFNPWNEAAITARDKFKEENDLEGFRKWLKDNKDRF